MRPVAGYRPFAELARGAAVVYKAYDPERERTVLLKVLTPEAAEDPALVAWFEGEARAVADIAHQNVVALYEAGRDGGRPFLAAEFIEGRALADVLAEGPLPADLAAYVVASAARGLSAAHERGLLHRDIKPGNVLLASDGQVKLTDFGLATRVGASEGDGSIGPSGSTPEQAGVRGTPGYLAPEVVRGDQPGPAADLFALGVVLVEALTGRPAFPATNAADALDAALHHDPVPALRADMRVPAGLADVAARLVAKAPSDRPDSAAAAAAALDAHRVRSPGAPGTGPAQLAAFLEDPAAYRDAFPLRALAVAAHPLRKPRTVVAAGVAVLALSLALGWLFTRDSRDAPEAVPPETTGGVAIGPVPADQPPQTALQAPQPTEATPPEREPDEANPEEPAADATQSDASAGTQTDPPEGNPATTATQPARGRLTVAVEPWADVTVDGRSIGTTPLSDPLELDEGTHRVVLRNPDFPEHAVDVGIRAGETERLAVSLWSLVARVSFEVSPWAEVSLNGRAIGTTPLRRAVVLPPGTHTFTLRHPTLGVREERVSVAAGETRTVRVRLGGGAP